MVDKSLTKKTLRVKIILFTALFILASVSTFYGTRLSLPIVTYYGRGALTTLPATFTFAIPLFTLIILTIYSRTGSVAKRWKVIFIYSLVMLAVALINIVDILFVVGLLYNWNFIVGVMTPIYPLDLLIFNFIFLAIGAASLFFAIVKKTERQDLTTDETKQTPKKRLVLTGFFFAFACYYFGEALFGINNLFEGYIDSNIGLTIPVYLLFLLLAAMGLVYIIYFHSCKEKQLKRGLIGVISILAITAFLLLWILIGFAINPYYFSESLQEEFAMGYALKVPFGLFILLGWILIPSLIALIRLIKQAKQLKKEAKN